MVTHTFKIKGSVKLFNSGELILEKNNSIQPGSRDIIRKALAGYGSSRITQASIYNGSSYLADTSLFRVPELISDAQNNKVKFIFNFDKDSFTGEFNKIIMSTGNGIFSELTGFTNTKSGTQNLKVEWLIEINIV